MAGLYPACHVFGQVPGTTRQFYNNIVIIIFICNWRIVRGKPEVRGKGSGAEIRKTECRKT
jgi:hypothetical protein